MKKSNYIHMYKLMFTKFKIHSVRFNISNKEKTIFYVHNNFDFIYKFL